MITAFAGRSKKARSAAASCGMFIAVLSGASVGTGYAAQTLKGRYETSDALALNFYGSGPKPVGSLVCKKPDAKNGLFTFFVFLPRVPTDASGKAMKAGDIPAKMALVIDGLFGTETFQAERVQLQFDGGPRLAGDMSALEVKIAAALLGAGGMKLVVNGSPIDVTLDPAGYADMVNACGEIRDALK